MCIRVRSSHHVTTPWNPEADAITIPAGLPRTLRLTAARAVLEELRIAQPSTGAVCWCGAAVDVDPVTARPDHDTQTVR